MESGALKIEEMAVEPELYQDISHIIYSAKSNVYTAVNTAMVDAYWLIGKRIVEEEQQGKERAEYGQALIKKLSIKLQTEFGKGFDLRNLRNMRAFYQIFPKRNALRSELNWTHYRSLLRIKDSKSRLWYMQEAITQNRSARALDRQIGALYYERLLSNKDPAPVAVEAKKETGRLQVNPKDYLRDPYIFDFLNLPNQSLLEKMLKISFSQYIFHSRSAF